MPRKGKKTPGKSGKSLSYRTFRTETGTYNSTIESKFSPLGSIIVLKIGQSLSIHLR